MGRDGQSFPLHALGKREAVPWWHDNYVDLYIVCLGCYDIGCDWDILLFFLWKA